MLLQTSMLSLFLVKDHKEISHSVHELVVLTICRAASFAVSVPSLFFLRLTFMP